MSCANKSCFCNAAETIKFSKLPCTAHVVQQSELDSRFAIVNLDGVIFMELLICPIEGSGFTALFEVTPIDGGFGVVVPDYVADINEKLLSDLGIVPIIADDPEVEDDDEDEAADEEVVSDECSDDADDCEAQDSADIQKLDKDAKRMITRALRTNAGKDLFRSFAAAKTVDEKLYWLDKLLDFILWLDAQDGEHSQDDCDKTATQGVARAEDFVKTFLNGLAAVTSFGGCEKSDTRNTAEPKHKCHGCGSCGGSCASGDRQTEEPATKEAGEKFAKSQKKRRTATRWSTEDVNLLAAAAKKFLDKNGNICWENVAKATGRSAEACRNKYGRLSSLA